MAELVKEDSGDWSQPSAKEKQGAERMERIIVSSAEEGCGIEIR